MPKLSPDQKFICPLPWIHIATTPAGTIRLCCDSVGECSRSKDKNGKNFKIDKSLPADFLNSDNFNSVRLEMLDGVIPKSCNNCFKSEEQLGDSPRLRFLKKYEFSLEKAKKLTSKIGSLKKIRIKSIDMRLGNNCNLKCRMCNPWSSLSLGKEFEELFEEKVPDLNWPDQSSRWLQVIQNQEELTDLYLTGGEPTLIKNNLVLLEGMSSFQRENVKIRMNTNGTILNKEFFKELASFNKNVVKISLDGIGLVNDYIRFPSKWSDILSNIEELKSIDNLNISTHLTLSSYNVLSLQETLDGFEKLGLPIPFVDFVRMPEEMSIFSLPPIFKQRFEEMSDNGSSQIIHSVSKSIGSQYRPEAFETLRKKTKIVDNYRNSHIGDYIPALGELLK